MLQRSLVGGFVLAIAMGLAGCGTVFGAAIGGSSGAVKKSATLNVATEPVGAEIFEQVGENYVPHGVSPTIVEVGYETTAGNTVGTWIGAGLGTAVDLGLSYWLYTKYADAKDKGDSIALPVSGMVLMGLALLCDVAYLGGNAEKVTPASVTLLAKATGHLDAKETVSVPGESDTLLLRLPVKTDMLTADQLKQRSIAKQELGSILVTDIKAGRGMPADLGRLVTNLTTSEIQKLSKNQVLSMADVQATLSAEKAKETLGCSEVSCYADIGAALGTDLVLAGEVEVAGSYLVISYRLVDTKRTAAVGRVSHRIKVEGSQEDAVVTGIPEAVEALLAATSPR